MSEDLYKRIEAMDPKRPYVWRLRISTAEFKALEADVAAKKATPRQTLVYLAEWYRRCYDGSASPAKAVELSASEIEELWKEAGFDAEACAYRYEKKEGVAWEYSTYVLGGLAVRFETGKKDRKFFRQLCRLYYGEDVALDDVVDQNGRSVAFRQSIARHQSLYHFIQAILKDELVGDDALTNELIQLVKTANDDVLRDKFAFEWLVRYQPGNDYMRRSLRLNLKPEEIGGKCHSYVRYERALAWGVADPSSVKCLSFAVSFEDGKGYVLVRADFDHPVLSCINVGMIEAGHGAFAVTDPNVKIEFSRVPARPFARVRLWVKADAGAPREVYAEEIKSWRQYWCEDEWSGLWSTRKNDRKATAVLVGAPQDIVVGAEELKRLPFKDCLDSLSPIFGWCVVRDFLVIKGEEQPVYNHAGTDKVYARLYPQTICYEVNGCVKHSFLDEDGEEEPSESLPIIFRKDDVLICHQEGDAAKEAPNIEGLVPEKVEFKDGGSYREWTETQHPAVGLVTLRATYRGREFSQQRMFYYPGLFEKPDASQPVVRDFAEHAIRYRGADGDTQKIVCQLPNENESIPRTLELRLDGGADCVRLAVYAPFDDKEIHLDGRLVKRLHAGETALLPYLLKERAQIRDFGEHGYRTYDCGCLGSLYQTPFIGDEDNAALNHWNEGRKVKATQLDAQAPGWLEVGFGMGAAESATADGIQYWKWVYSEAGEPVLWESKGQLPAFSVAFQNLAADDAALRIVFPKMPGANVNRLAHFRRPNLASPYRCYAVATKFRQYFFIFEPLRKMLQERRDEIRQEILEPLLQERGGRLKRADYHDLMRLSEEGRFDWFDLGVNLAESVQADEETV